MTIEPTLQPRRFSLYRVVDETGVSGIGYVADGCEFANGKAVLCWRGMLTSVAVYDDIDSLMKIHGHEGQTKLEWIDE